MSYSLTIIIPTYNGMEHLKRCLPSVCRYAPHGTQIIVVDDASTDGTAAWLKEHFPAVEVVALPVNGGFCKAVNTGLEQARGDIVELLNNDTEVYPGWVEPCLRHFDDPAVGSVAPLVLVMDQPDVIDCAGQEYHVCGWAYNRRFGQPLSDNDLSPREVFCPSGSSGFYRRSAIEQVGPLLPEYEAYFEDTDLGFRLRQAGYRCIYEPASRVQHRTSATYGRQSKRAIRLVSKNEELVFWINLPARDLLLGLLPHAGFQTIRLLSKLKSGQVLPYLHGKWQALALWRQIWRRRREMRALRSRAKRMPDLALSRDLHIVRQGWSWLRERKCA